MAAELTVANNILAQLGGNRFIVMTGAKNIMGDQRPDGLGKLSFRLPRYPGLKINHVEITLNAMDLYDVRFHQIKGRDVALLATHENVYAEDLRRIFERATGLRTSL